MVDDSSSGDDDFVVRVDDGVNGVDGVDGDVGVPSVVVESTGSGEDGVGVSGSSGGGTSFGLNDSVVKWFVIDRLALGLSPELISEEFRVMFNRDRGLSVDLVRGIGESCEVLVNRRAGELLDEARSVGGLVSVLVRVSGRVDGLLRGLEEVYDPVDLVGDSRVCGNFLRLNDQLLSVSRELGVLLGGLRERASSSGGVVGSGVGSGGGEGVGSNGGGRSFKALKVLERAGLIRIVDEEGLREFL